MYKIKETETALEVRSKTAMGFVWTTLFLALLFLSLYMSFEYISIKCERPIEESANTTQKSKKGRKRKKLTPETRCYITHFDFKNGLQVDSILLSEIIRMDKGYFAPLENESDVAVHYNPTFITSQQERYALRRVSNVAFTPELLSKKFNDFIINKHPRLNIWDWYMGYWGIAAGVSFLGLLFLSVSGRYQVAHFNKEKHTFYIKNYGLLGFVEKRGNWKDIKRIIYQDKKTVHKKGIFFLVKTKPINSSSKKIKTKKIYFTHHTDEVSKEAAQKIADLIRPIVKPNT